MSNKINSKTPTDQSLYIKILIWAYEKQEAGFFEEELFDKFNLNEKQKNWYLKVFRSGLPTNNNLIDFLEYKDNKHTMALTAKGVSAAIAYQELQGTKEGSRRAEKIAMWAIVIGIITMVINIIATCFDYSALKKTQQSLELNSTPEITLNIQDAKDNKDGLKLPGHYNIFDSKVNFILKNIFLGKIEDVDIRMVILETHIDQKSKYFSICPFGYIDYTKNPNFIVGQYLLTTSILDNKLYSLDPREEKEFSIDYRNIKEVVSSTNSQFYIKVDIKFKKTIDKKQYSFSKIYKIHNLTTLSGESNGQTTEYLVDTDIDKEIVILNDKENEILSKTAYIYPIYLVYPFRNQNFIDIIKNKFTPPYSIQPSECEYFKIDPKIKSIE